MKRLPYMLLIVLILASPAGAQSTAGQQGDKDAAAKMPYANMPEQAVPYRKFRKPYYEWYVKPDTLQYNGAARDLTDGDLKKLKTINIGFLGPLGENNPESPYGIAMLHGAQLAIEEANARGGYHGKPFALKVHDDLPLWGASSMDIVKMRFKEHVWGMLGSIDGASTHIALRAALKLELPMVDTGTTDPTVTETRIQWLLHNFPDDRQQGYALADYIFNQLKLRHVGILRENARYARKGFQEFFNNARRMGYQPQVVVKYGLSERNFAGQLQTLNRTGIDALVIWGNAYQAGLILKQMRAMGMEQPVFGSSRVAYPEVLKVAGPAAEGLVTVCAINPHRQSAKWLEFREDFKKQFHAEPDPYASYAYDGMTMLIAAIEKAGLNRARIMDALRQFEMKDYQGVSGDAFFDYTLNNIAPLTFAKVKDGHFVYWPERRTNRERIPMASMR